MPCRRSVSVTDRKTIDAYTTRVAEYLSVPLPPEQIEARMAFAEAVVPGGYVLDLGSGPGADSMFFLREGLRVRALDATPAFVDHARENGVDAHLGTFDDVTETAEYDGIYASFSLLHAPREDFPRHLAAIHRALKPEGAFFLGLKLGTGEHRDGIDRYYTYFSQTEIEEALAEAGFTIDRITTGVGKGLAGSYDGFILVIAHA
nr:class I SAM-dependent methyltransferase [Ruegeria atlantica]